jgi:signal transduction histidine kinase
MSIALNRQSNTPDPELLATIAHDLRNPLTIVQTSAQLLRWKAQRRNAPSSAWIDRHLVEIEEAGLRMAHLIDEIVDLTRMREGNPLHLNRRPTDLSELAVQAAADAQATSARHSVRLELVESSVTGHWDTAGLRRVLENLLSNAIKYSPPGSEIVVRVAHAVTADGAWAILVVGDHGCGIPATDQPHIFEPYWRGSNVGRVAGSGLGLASVKQIVQAHGGSIAVESAEGEGTAFTMRLPRD